MKTIKQIADEVGVSKQAVFKKIKEPGLSTSLQGLMTTVDGKLMVSVDGQNLIFKAFDRQDRQPNREPVHQPNRQPIDGLVDALTNELNTPYVSNSTYGVFNLSFYLCGR